MRKSRAADNKKYDTRIEKLTRELAMLQLIMDVARRRAQRIATKLEELRAQSKIVDHPSSRRLPSGSQVRNPVINGRG